MKKTALFVVTAITGFCVFAQPVSPLPSRKWQATLKIIDEAGKPIDGADVQVSYMLPSPPGSPTWGHYGEYGDKIKGLTDTNGMFIASHEDRTPSLGFDVQKPRYYKTFYGYEMGLLDRDYTFEKWNPNLTLVLKQIGNPIPMYAKREEAKLQQEDKPMGFDLMAGDWVTPYGKGFHADMFFTVHRKIINKREYDCTFTITFPNKGDGIIVAPTESNTGSEFKTSRTAAESGYQPELDLHYSNTEQPQSVFGYFIRVRTELDQNGNVKSALYGKINGNFRFYAGTIAPTSGMGFDYYLNPTPNDRNVEFNPKRNLVKDLKPLEEVREP